MSTIGLAQTVTPQIKINSGYHEISYSDLRITNQIFVEHKNQKLVIKEQDNQINFLNNKIDLMQKKDSAMNGILNNKEQEIANIQKSSAIKEKMLNDELKVEKKTKNIYKISTIALVIAAIVAGFAK